MPVTTTQIALTGADWTDLGLGPLEIQPIGGPLALAVADAKPDPGDSGFLTSAAAPIVLQTSTHVWAKAAGGPSASAFVTVAPVAAIGGGGGGSGALGASENHLGEVSTPGAVATASFVRPANTTAYAAYGLMANSTAAASVAPLAFPAARKNGGLGTIKRARLSSSNPLMVGTTVRLHLFKGSPDGAALQGPVATVGDGGAFDSGSTNSTLAVSNGIASVPLGFIDIPVSLAYGDGAKGIGAPSVPPDITFDTVAGFNTIFGLLELRTAYTPVSGETITVALEVEPK